MVKRCGIALFAALLALAVWGCGSEQTEQGEPERPTGRAGSAETAEAPPVHFYREYVVIEPSEYACRVNGLYYMRNLTDRPLELGIEYPFPVGGPNKYPFQIFVDDVTDEGETPMGFIPEADAVRFTLRFEPEQERAFRVRYAQQVKGGRATYIVTTTKRWQRPIERAEFEIRIPAELQNPTISMEPDRVEVRGDTTFYYVLETDFYPDEDIIVSWED
jgi:hypothetical protein